MDNKEFINKVLEEDKKKETDPSRIIALEIFQLTSTQSRARSQRDSSWCINGLGYDGS